MQILLVNDDGLDSPALIPTIQELEKIGDVKTIVPRHQQSWTSKSNIRRGKDLRLSHHEISGHHVLALDALPADCANYGLFMEEYFPDILVSGANVGHNVGLAAFYSSGTVGAALEGLLVGVPSIAVSVPYQADSRLEPLDFEASVLGLSSLVNQFYLKRCTNYAMMMINLPYGRKFKEIMASSVEIMNFGALFHTDNNGLVQPVHYPRLKYPALDELTQGSDAWAREHDIGSIVLLDRKGMFIDPSIVENWLMDLELDPMIAPIQKDKLISRTNS
jgi:5'/3'-nucleotidase SurE